MTGVRSSTECAEINSLAKFYPHHIREDIYPATESREREGEEWRDEDINN
jgi:hypothetical protein